MSKNSLPPDTTALEEEKTDAYYSEELSRAAVGRLFDDDEDEPPDVKSAFVTGFDRAPSDEKNPTRRRVRPPAPEPEPEEEPEEPVADRGRRRETATTRLLHGAAEDNYDMERRRRRNPNPSPKPAVRVNVPVERPAREPREKTDDGSHTKPVGEDLETFRRRYNSQELFSPPRNQNRPVRQGRADVRTNRIRPSDRDMESISPMRMIIACTALVVLILFSVITFQMISYRNKFREAGAELLAAQDAIAQAQQTELVLVPGLRETISDLEREAARLQRIIDESEPADQHNIPPDSPPNVTPAPSPTPGLPSLPTTTTVPRGGSLSSIARRYYGNNNPATIQHIQNVNNISDPNRIQEGQVLQLTPMN
jgi:nucleoid-associated protein YgaU